MRAASLGLAASVLLACGVSCVGTTGGGLITFDAYGAGPADAASPLVFDTETGFHVELTTATLHIGAVYLTATAGNPGSQNTSCIEPGQYLAEVTGAADVNLLSPTPQPFAVQGDASIDVARTGEIWLTGGDINAPADPTKIVTLAGTASRGGQSWPFEATVTIGDNRSKPIDDPAQPGLNPICKRRIVQVSPIDTRIKGGASLVVRVDPRAWFNLADFSQLDVVQTTPTTLYQFPDSDDDAKTGAALFTGILTGVLPSGQSAYSFSFQ
jgi:hypothetical protein